MIHCKAVKIATRVIVLHRGQVAEDVDSHRIVRY